MLLVELVDELQLVASDLDLHNPMKRFHNYKRRLKNYRHIWKVLRKNVIFTLKRYVNCKKMIVEDVFDLYDLFLPFLFNS